MKPIALVLADKEDYELFREIKMVVEAMPEVDLGVDAGGEKVEVSCHMLCRALAKFFPVVCCDGYFGPPGKDLEGKWRKSKWRHSWLTPANPYATIDPYPYYLASGPIMPDTRHFTSPWFSLYRKARLTELGGQEFRRHVRIVTRVVKETIKSLGLDK